MQQHAVRRPFGLNGTAKFGTFPETDRRTAGIPHPSARSAIVIRIIALIRVLDRYRTDHRPTAAALQALSAAATNRT